MDFGKTFSYVFEDPDWLKKVGLGGVISLVPILNFAATGYSLEVARRVINNEPRPLPEWDDIGGKLVKGLLVAVIGFVYMLPVLLLACIMQIAQVLLVGGTSALSSPSSSSSGAAGAAGTAAIVVMGCLGCLMLLYELAVGVVLPAALGNYAAKGELGAAFRFGEVLGLVQKNLGTYLMVLVIEVVAALAATLVGLILCGIGLYFTVFYAMLVIYYAFGLAYREASAQVGLV